MKWITFLVALAVLVPLVPTLVVMMRRGPRRGGGGAAFGVLQELADPSRRHAVVARDERVRERLNDEPLD